MNILLLIGTLVIGIGTSETLPADEHRRSSVITSRGSGGFPLQTNALMGLGGDFDDVLPVGFPMSFIESLIGSVFENIASMPLPNISIAGEDCILSVGLSDLSTEASHNVRVLTNNDFIVVEITQVKKTTIDNGYSSMNSNTTLMPGGDLHNALRGGSSFSQMTFSRRIPAPEGCNVMSSQSKATFDDKTKILRLKFPKMSEADNSEPPQAEPLEQDTKENATKTKEDLITDDAFVSSSRVLKQGPPKSSFVDQIKSWLGGNSNNSPVLHPVPMVKGDEF